MKKNNNSAWSEFVFEDETWKEDSEKERQHAQIQAAVQNFLSRGKDPSSAARSGITKFYERITGAERMKNSMTSLLI